MNSTTGGEELPPLTLSPDEMRRFGYRVVDLMVEHVTGLRDKPVATVKTRQQMADALADGFSEEPALPDDVLDRVARDILPAVAHVDHPRFFAFVPGTGNYVGALADALAAGYNVFAGHWLTASGPGAVEIQTIDWLRRECGLPDTTGGLFVSGGSMANLTALAVARQMTLGGSDPLGVAYCSSQTHNSVAKGMRVLGFRDDQFRTVACDDELRLSMPALRAAIAEDRAAGRHPFCIVANAGTTNAGAVDPLVDLADLCAAEKLWLHVDGAYGAAAVITERGRAELRGLDRADSITLDPHKWLFQPFEIGCVLVRDAHHMRLTFSTHHEEREEYLKDVKRALEREVIFFDHGVQLTRSFRALKLWMTLRIFGTRAMRDAVTRGIVLAEETERLIRAGNDFDIVTSAQLGVVTFTPRMPNMSPERMDEIVRQVVEGSIAGGVAMVTSTVINERTVLRMCTINPSTTVGDVELTLAHLADLSRQAADRAAASNIGV